MLELCPTEAGAPTVTLHAGGGDCQNAVRSRHPRRSAGGPRQPLGGPEVRRIWVRSSPGAHPTPDESRIRRGRPAWRPGSDAATLRSGARNA